MKIFQKNHRLAQGKHFISWLLLAACLLVLSGCGFGTRYIFSSSDDVLATPAQAGLVFEEIWFPSADGVLLHGWLVPGEQDQPLVVFFHGNAANITHRVDNLLYLHRLGLPVFIFDYRGFGASQGQARSEEDLYQDARGALQWLGQRGWNPDQMIFYGRSMGAAVALQAALEKPPRGLVLECPFTSLRDIAWEMTPLTYALLGWWSIDARFDNHTKIAALKRPLLVVHGERDHIIPWDMGKRLYQQAPPPKTFLSIPGAGHSDAYQVGGAAYQLAWSEFLLQVKSL